MYNDNNPTNGAAEGEETTNNPRPARLPPITQKTNAVESNDPTFPQNEKQHAINNIITPAIVGTTNNPIVQTIITKMSSMPPKHYGVNADELCQICSFDERNSPQLVQTLNNQYGGAVGVAHNLRSHPETGLKRVDTSANSYHYQSFVKKGQVSPGDDTKQQKENNLNNNNNNNHTTSTSDSSSTEKKFDMTVEDAEERRTIFGTNIIPPPPSETIFEMIIGQIKEDVILKVLIIGALVVIVLGSIVCPSEGWVEGFTILIAVVIVLGVTAGNDYSKDKKFKKLLLLQSEKNVKVIRGGVKDQISSWDLLVGDLVEISPGDEIPVDGLYVSGTTLAIDESPLTGETLPVKKNESNPFLFSGCQVNEGTAVMIATGVGVRSMGGQIQKMLNEAQGEETVLQEKLKVVAVQIGKIGVAAGILTFLALSIRLAYDWATDGKPPVNHCGTVSNDIVLARLQELATHFVVGITVVVVAVPEGLPLAVTISLAFSMFKMMKDKCFVRQLEASETMGQATVICTDKTGTLTENRMTVVKLLVGENIYNGEGSGSADAIPFSPTTLPTAVNELLCESACVNSTCFIKYKDNNPLPVFVGSASEGALLVFCQKLGKNYETMRTDATQFPGSVWPFNSDRKRMSTLCIPKVSSPTTDRYRLYTKGASEVVFNMCTDMLSSDGAFVSPITPDTKERVHAKIKEWASEGLRTFVLAYRDTSILYEKDSDQEAPESSLVFIGLVGIKDPVRKEVPGAVAQCLTAGLSIKMVTGDNILTACKIARECGILTEEGVAMEGPEFRVLSESEKKVLAPKLQVLARSSPGDKFVLVSLLKQMGQVVAVTGDGTNDAPALKEADVGFAMGICGTQIAINASDIILMDDNFVSIVQSIRWGRNVLDSVRKFLQFQLGVNLVAIAITLIGSIVSGESPLNTVQLLWVNLIMDSLGALALGF